MLRLLRLSVLQALLEQLTWRGFLVTIVMGQVVSPLLGLAVWSAALPGRSAVSRYYVAILAVQMMTVSFENHTFSLSVYDGTLSESLVRPQPVVITTLGTNLSLRIWHLLFGLPLILAVGALTGVSFSASQVLVALPALLLAAALRFVFTYSLALSAFWSQQAMGVVTLGDTLIFLLGGVAAPLTLFPVSLRAIVEALPFGAMLGFPAEVASGALRGPQIGVAYAWQIAWIIVFVLVVMTIWKLGVRRYTSVGG